MNQTSEERIELIMSHFYEHEIIKKKANLIL